MTALFPGPRIAPATLLREHELPTPLAVRVRVLAGQCVRQFDAAVAIRHILLMNSLYPLEVFLQGMDDSARHCRDSVFGSLSLADGDLAAF